MKLVEESECVCQIHACDNLVKVNRHAELIAA